ncbi:hypothetical protein G6O69_13760 [Pseudenhygromyxa sp. WMMC2535]|uniref:hypothetical protein n=1 Tax=Pseudenhygromyxa sp. WMMC2535 TaxID=2712867 RepID=UPI001554EA1F|nr:hypothetical protein [Pseudenhygromyxa sp. WMMC2535]NVB38903.1 hypothetical protein [Pseudenhygromyxa sp. WMMC2535]
MAVKTEPEHAWPRPRPRLPLALAVAIGCALAGCAKKSDAPASPDEASSAVDAETEDGADARFAEPPPGPHDPLAELDDFEAQMQSMGLLSAAQLERRQARSDMRDEAAATEDVSVEGLEEEAPAQDAAEISTGSASAGSSRHAKQKKRGRGERGSKDAAKAERPHEGGGAPGQAPAPAAEDDVAMDAAADRCESVCGLAEGICELEVRICELGEAHPEDPAYADACERAIEDCELASDACERCHSE